MEVFELCFKSCPREGASNAKGNRQRDTKVSSRAPVRGHHRLCLVLRIMWSFKSCPREGASSTITSKIEPMLCFKSCPREGASALASSIAESLQVSSRAPVRGHQKYWVIWLISCCFKSCPREGASPRSIEDIVGAFVSSRAPVRGHPLIFWPFGARIMFQVVPP